MAAAPKPKEFSIRLTPGLYRRIKAAAVAGGRTVNSEIISRLAASFDFQTVDETINAAAATSALHIEAVLLRYLGPAPDLKPETTNLSQEKETNA